VTKAACADRVSKLTPPRLTGPVVVAISFVAMLAWTWFKWPDPLIDFGRELYLAWQVAQGKTLYRDVEHFNGPLSVYFNALLFRLFGASIQTLAYANILIAGAIVSFIYAIVRKAADDITATACGITFVALFACVQFVDTGNYNLITPYSHEVTHGMLLALAAMWCVVRLYETHKLRFALTSGALLGLAWLTKLEIFLAAAAAVGVGLLLSKPVAQTVLSVSSVGGAESETQTGMSVPPSFQSTLLTMGAMFVVIAVAFLLLLTQLSAGNALRGVMGSAYYLTDSGLTSLPFYRRIAGIDAIAQNAAVAVVSAAAIALLLGMRYLMELPATRGKNPRPSIIIAIVLPPAVAFSVGPWFPWHLALRSLPLVIVVLLIIESVRIRRGGASVSSLARLMFLVFSLALLAKIALAVQLQHYGFALAMPATLAVVATLVRRPIIGSDAISPSMNSGRGPGGGSSAECADPAEALPPTPSRSTRRGSPNSVSSVSLWFKLSWFGLSVVATFIAVHLSFYHRRFADKPVHIAAGPNAFFASAGTTGQPSRGESLAALLEQVEARVASAATLAVVPEGAMINFLTGRSNPTPFITLQPPEYLMFGGERITRAYQQSPPDFVVINLTVDPAEYGSAGFDVDYGKTLADWIKQHYTPVWRDGPAGRLVLLRRTVS